MTYKENKSFDLPRMIAPGEEFRLFGDGSKENGDLTGSNFFIRTPFHLEGFGAGDISFLPELLGTIRKTPGSYLAPKGLPSLEKGAREKRGFGMIEIAFPFFNPAMVEGEQPCLGVTIRLLGEEDGQSDLVLKGIPEIWRRPDGSVLAWFKQFENDAGQKGALLLPFKRGNIADLNRLLLQIKGRFFSFPS